MVKYRDKVQALVRQAHARLFTKHKQTPPYDRDSVDVFIISYPKCGRTWLRLMLGKALALHFDLESEDLFEPYKMAAICPDIPLIEFTHEGSPHLKAPEELPRDKSEYKGRKVILLFRDIRDVVVSYYFEVTKRNPVLYGNASYSGDLSSFLREDRGSVATIINFYNIWAENRHIPDGFLLLRYEDLHLRPEYELRRVLEMLHVEATDSVIQNAVEFARFENMHQMEKEDTLHSWRLRPADKNDPDSFKTRKGKIGGFIDYLSEEDIRYLNHRISTELSDFYGCDMAYLQAFSRLCSSTE